MQNVRALAAEVLLRVCVQREFLGHALEDLTAGCAVKDQALVQAMCYGVLRHYFRLQAMLKLYLDKPLKSKDQDIELLLCIGLYQLSSMRIPPHAVIAETVSAAQHFKKVWAKGLINAVLRSYQRDPKPLPAIETVGYEHPAWLRKRLMQAYPERWQAIVMANLLPPPMHIRINRLKTTPLQYLELLNEQGIEAKMSDLSPEGMTLAQAVDVSRLPYFTEGWVSVQDLAAQMAASILNAQAHERILDACAAPGGKTAHILECSPKSEMWALDVEPVRIGHIRNTLNRLGLSANVLCADATQVSSWWDGRLFDRILIDAPCSALGVIRRHPDIRLMRTEAEIEVAVAAQAAILQALWPTLKPGGRLVYATCSVLPAENDEQIAKFLAAHRDAKLQDLVLPVGIKTDYGWQFLPSTEGPDGFYYSSLQKIDG